MANRNEQETIYIIPRNFHIGISIMGTTFETVYVFQTILFVIPGWLISFVLLPKIPFLSRMDFSAKLSVAIAWTAIFGFLCINGINEKPLFQFLKDINRFKKTKKHAFYNKKIKFGIKPSYIEDEKDELLPRDKLMQTYQKLKASYKQKQIEEASKLNEDLLEDTDNLYFEDDIGYFDKPEEYMNKKERRAYLKAQKKKQKKGEALNGKEKGKEDI